MPWNYDNKLRYLDQLYEECRYYRRFHHTVFSAAVAGYIALIGLQAILINNNPNISFDSNYLLIIIYGIAVILLFIVPILLSCLFIRYHFVQGDIQYEIYILQNEVGFPDKLLKNKYCNFKNISRLKKFTTGGGHIYFIAILWLIVLSNIGIFLILFKIVT